MSGQMSRNKGKRAEYLVRDFLRKMGYADAVRVPLSGASEGFKGDVVFTNHSGKKITIEVKSRQNSFSTVYKKYVDKTIHHPTLGIISVYRATLDDVFTEEVDVESKRDAGVFETLYKLMAGADFLAIKDNNKQLLFVEFEGDDNGTGD